MKTFETSIEYLRSKFKDGKLTMEPKTTLIMKSLELETSLSQKLILNGLKKIEREKIEPLNKEKFLEICRSASSVKKRRKDYTLIIPVNYKISKRIIEYCDRSYKVYSDKTIVKAYGEIEFEDPRLPKAHPFKINTWQKYFLETNVKAVSLIDAIHQIYHELESLCGFINTILGRNKLNVVINKKTNEASFDIGTIMYSINKSSYEYLHWNRASKGISATRQIKYFEDNEKSNLNLGLKKIKQLKKDSSFIDSLLYDTFTLYYRAKTAIQNENEFMYYWRVCENIVLSDEIGGDTKKTLNRAMSLANFLTPYNVNEALILKKLSEIRNNFVHRGRIDFDMYYTSIMGSISNSLLFWLIDNRNKFNAKEDLIHYLKNKNTNKKSLKSMLTSLRLIEKERK